MYVPAHERDRRAAAPRRKQRSSAAARGPHSLLRWTSKRQRATPSTVAGWRDPREPPCRLVPARWRSRASARPASPPVSFSRRGDRAAPAAPYSWPATSSLPSPSTSLAIDKRRAPPSRFRPGGCLSSIDSEHAVPRRTPRRVWWRGAASSGSVVALADRSHACRAGCSALLAASAADSRITAPTSAISTRATGVRKPTSCQPNSPSP